MTRYKQYATTAYNGLDFTILNTTPTSPAIPEPLNITTYLTTWSKVFQPPDPSSNPSSSQNDLHMTSSLTYATTWLLRLYDDVFPDDTHTPLSHLHNFLAIPQQFMVTCLQFANYSVPPDLARELGIEGRFALPGDMQTVASRGVSTTRLLAVGWVVWVYIASAGVVVVAVGGVILGMVVRREGIPASTGFVEVDLAARFQLGEGGENISRDGDGGGDGLRAMRELGRARGRKAAVSSSLGVARELRRRRIRVVAVAAEEGRNGGSGRSKAYVGFAFREGLQFDRSGGNESGLDVLARANTNETKVASPGTEVSWYEAQ